ncbi:asparagine synthase-related protein [Acanthopleuribacter pedis]|uniref:asparagine synthase (glutamine-hydrolyzing) n=1 Tax=Acanthopleuribacter pedis TaxID=442870 RepID=A0A8J7QC30_9BACT|nr:asparagine synthase-related protein [Acanthopleuribacter pedis]MBO1321015.1 hypothetical protein [Acanthopleuribacter pedis]
MSFTTVTPLGKPLPPILLHQTQKQPPAAFFEAWRQQPEFINEIDGHFATVLVDDDGTYHLLRDPLGVHKLFFAFDPERGFAWSPLLHALREAGYPPRTIWSLPSACCARFNPSQRRWSLQRYREWDYGAWSGESATTITGRIRARLDRVFAQLAAALGDIPVWVTLSGGLDSTGIAAMARRFFSKVEGVTFALDLDRRHVAAGEDLHYARLAADHLSIPLREIHVDGDTMAEQLNNALIHGQDWRDFNVHCALVNACIGAHGDLPPGSVLLTGDTMNELVADYSPVPFAGQTFYPLPRLKPGRLRRFLVSGLDSGDREVGVFHHFDLTAIQPYALCADAYTALPDAWLANDDAKSALVRQVMGDLIPAAIYARPKVRAQVGNDQQQGGTLAAMVARGINGDHLKERFAAQLNCAPAFLDSFLRAGIYRSPLGPDQIWADPSA